MIKYLSANYIVPVSSAPLKNGVIAIDENGVIQGIYESTSSDIIGKKIEKYAGVIVPGFVNAHCHVELSHMRGQLAKGTGLPKFLSSVMSSRDAKKALVVKHMNAADEEMYANGIVAVGDHVNTSLSADLKNESKIHYHTFVEIIGLEPELVDGKVDGAKNLRLNFDEKFSSITPHAPYSCSKQLFKKFKKSVSEDNIISIHNQESEEENKLFRYKTGDFLDFFEVIGKDVDLLKAQARNSIQSYLPYLPQVNKLMLVHNTFTSLKDLDFVERMGREIYWCFCPKSNLYIENALPKVMNFVNDNQKIVLGTDSLASNDTLSILEELRALHAEFPELDFTQTISWATLNGAELLRISDRFGSLEFGKKPGIILLKNMIHLKITDDVTVERLA